MSTPRSFDFSTGVRLICMQASTTSLDESLGGESTTRLFPLSQPSFGLRQAERSKMASHSNSSMVASRTTTVPWTSSSTQVF
jgi:hypothetical protein